MRDEPARVILEITLVPTVARPADSRLRVLSARVLSIQEEERRHISRDLHDDVGQSLAALKFCLHRLLPLSQGEAHALVTDCIGMADSTLERVRSLSREMHPPELDALGLEEALRSLVERLRAASAQDNKCHFNGLLNRRFPLGMESACYRIAQEALGNATRHAGASSILLTLEAGPRLLTLTVRDDGRGFDTRKAARRALKAASLGLISMDERARLAGGRLTVRGNPGQGAIIRAVFRCASGPAAA
jgi:signal transduction histidine kinase